MTRYARLFALSAFVLGGCDSASTADGGARPMDAGAVERDAGPPFDAGRPFDAGPVTDAGFVCGDPDTACPASLPHPAAPCSVGLSCEYPEENGTWTYTCSIGRWEASSTCTAPDGASCPIPPLGETCDTPFGGTLAGGTVEIGPMSTLAFRAFADLEMVTPVYGGQGSPMIPYRLRIDGVDAPECVRAVTTLSSAITETVSEPRTVRLRCSESLGIFTTIVPGTGCPDEPVQVQLTADVTGIGSATVTLLIPGRAFCGALPG